MASAGPIALPVANDTVAALSGRASRRCAARSWCPMTGAAPSRNRWPYCVGRP